jgi:hypothetical protein
MVDLACWGALFYKANVVTGDGCVLSARVRSKSSASNPLRGTMTVVEKISAIDSSGRLLGHF